MKSLRHGGPRAMNLTGENEEAALVERMQRELKDIDDFTQKFARNVVDWAKMTSNVVLALRAWAVSFGKVIGLSPDQESEAFNAFLALVERRLMPLCVRLESVINEKLLKEIAHLLTTMNQPLKLLASMNDQEPYHYHLMTMNVSNRHLPQYIALLHRGLAIFVRRLAEIQTNFWRDVRNCWAELWEMLRVEGEWNAGHAETVNVWCARWMDVCEIIEGLNIVQQKKLYQEPVRYSMDSTSSGGKKRSSPAVSSMLSSLEPVHVVGQYAVSGPYPLTPSIKSRGRGNSDASIGGGQMRRSVGRKSSNDSLHSGKSSRKGKSPRREFAPPEYMIPDVPTLPRTQSMTLPTEKPVRPSNSRTTTGYTDDGYGPRPSTSRSTTGGFADDGHSGYGYGYRQIPDSAPVQMQYFEQERERERDRGRISPGGNSYKRKSAENPPRRPSNSRSNTSSFPQGSYHQYDPEPALMPNRRDSWATRPAKYVCQVIHHCNPPPSVSYFSFPFFRLKEGEFFEVLQEAGHPSIHPKLPLYVDEGEDCLLLCRDSEGMVGWALASFLEPVSIPR
ncbi:hypothetical protein BDQ17DRAFT_1344256 [Cyathus striatus]|nr:hypothetical protein BDQ17DRAFT_1344256 [Cyathus striatus]